MSPRTQSENFKFLDADTLENSDSISVVILIYLCMILNVWYRSGDPVHCILYFIAGQLKIMNVSTDNTEVEVKKTMSVS
jgi:hypothetical protein